MAELSLNEFHNLSKEKQSLAMFQMLKENRRMLRLILESEVSRGSSFSDQSKPWQRNDQQYWSESEQDKSATVHVNVGGKTHEVYFNNFVLRRKVSGLGMSFVVWETNLCLLA